MSDPVAPAADQASSAVARHDAVAGGHEAHGGFDFLPEVMLLLLVAVLVAPLFQRIRLTPVLGYLAAGVIVGPEVLGLMRDEQIVVALAELGVVFLLFTIGLELSLERLMVMRRLVFGLGGLQVLLTGSLFSLIGAAVGLAPPVALILGFALSLSSTAVVLQLLTERHETGSRHGRVSFAILLLQDLAVVPLLVLVELMASPDGSVTWVVVEALAKAAAVVAAIVVLGRLLIRPLFRIVAGARSPEAFTALALLAVLATASGTWLAGLSMALGAFLAGLLMAGSEYRHQVEADIQPVKGLFLGLFFVSVGISLEMKPVVDQPGLVVAILAGMMGLKAVVIAGLTLAFRRPPTIALRSGLLLAQGGEFAFVLIGLAVGQGVVADAVAQPVLAAVGISIAVTPLLELAGRRIASALERRGEEAHAPALAAETASLAGHVLVAGYGRVGQTVARIVANQNIPWLALDLDASHVTEARQHDLPVYYGDASRQEVLKAAGIDRARIVCVTLNDPHAAAGAVRAIRAMSCDIGIYVRAHDLAHSDALRRLGATEVVPETLEASLQLAGRVLQAADVPQQAAQIIVEDFRRDRYAGLYGVEDAEGSEADREKAAALERLRQGQGAGDRPAADGTVGPGPAPRPQDREGSA